MALLNNIVLDLTAQTAILTVTSLGAPIETITFSNHQITFSTRPLNTISGTEFLDLIAQINIFQTAILANFPENIFATTPYNTTECIETHDIINNDWNLVCIFGPNPRVVNYSADGVAKTVILLNRGNNKTIEFPEWIYLLFALNHYKSSVKKFFNL